MSGAWPAESPAAVAVVWLVAGWAAYRATRFITADDVAEDLRAWWLRRFRPGSKGALFIDCPYCVGWWVSGATVGIGMAAGFVVVSWRWLVLWPAVAGLQAMLNAVDSRLA